MEGNKHNNNNINNNDNLRFITEVVVVSNDVNIESNGRILSTRDFAANIPLSQIWQTIVGCKML